jgi:hypothetical protein
VKLWDKSMERLSGYDYGNIIVISFPKIKEAEFPPC